MMCYASRTGTLRNLAALRAAGWGLLVSRAGEWRTEGFDRYGLDNGAWSDFQNSRPFDEDAFERLIDKLGSRADWIVLPDIVAGGLPSLELSMRWSNRCLSACQRALNIVRRALVGLVCSSGSRSSLCFALRKSALRSWSSCVKTGRPVSGLTIAPLNGPHRGAP